MKQLLLQKGKAGSTLVEVVVAIAILGLVTAPICSNMMVSARLNAKSRAMMAAQLQVSSAVEQLMAEGVTEEIVPGEGGTETIKLTASEPAGVEVDLPKFDDPDNPVGPEDYLQGKYCAVTVTSKDAEEISVKTVVKIVKDDGTGGTT